MHTIIAIHRNFRRNVALLALLLGLTLLQACAGMLTAEEITFVPIEEIRQGGAAVPARGFVSTSQPDEAALRAVADAGYVGVVDLRTAAEDRGIDEADTVEKLGMRYVSLPIGGADDVSWENAARLDRVLADFDGPVLLHCASGNRVGALFALREKSAGADNAAALAKGRAAGLTRLEDVVRQRLHERDDATAWP